MTALDTNTTAAPTAPNHHILVAQELRQAARFLGTTEGSRRTYYRSLGLRPRRRDIVFKVLFILAFSLGFAAPLALGSVYILVFASPQYQAETRFVLRSALPALAGGNADQAATKATFKIVQDTLILQNYLDSAAFVARLDGAVDFATVFGGADVDRWWRLKARPTLEDKTTYLRALLDSNVNPNSGIVTLKLRSFTPDTAQDTLTVIVALAEDRVNQLNADIWDSVLTSAQARFTAAADQLRLTRAQYGALQNETGVFSVDLQAKALSKVLRDLRSTQLELENRRATMVKTMATHHPHVVHIDQRIAARADQITTLEHELASSQTGLGSLASRQQQFEALALTIDIAQDRFKIAAAQLEQAKILSSVQMVYLDQFLQPTLPQTPVYPRAAWEILRLLGGCFIIWTAVVLGLRAAQRRLD